MTTLGGLSCWSLSDHAREQLAERAISATELDRALSHPEHTSPDPKGNPNVRYRVAAGVLAVVDEAEMCVITVGYDGHNKASGKTASDQRTGDVAVPDIAHLDEPAPRRRRPTRPTPAAVTKTYAAHPGLYQEALQRAGGDPRRLRVLSWGRIEVLPAVDA